MQPLQQKKETLLRKNGRLTDNLSSLKQGSKDTRVLWVTFPTVLKDSFNDKTKFKILTMLWIPFHIWLYGWRKRREVRNFIMTDDPVHWSIYCQRPDSCTSTQHQTISIHLIWWEGDRGRDIFQINVLICQK